MIGFLKTRTACLACASAEEVSILAGRPRALRIFRCRALVRIVASAMTPTAMDKPRGKPYSQDLRDRVLDAQGAIRALAERFGADEAIDPGDTRARLMAAIVRLPVLPLRQPVGGAHQHPD